MAKIDLRRALNKIAIAISDNYLLPDGKFIQSEFGLSNECRNPFFGQTKNKVKFSFGSEKELNIWLDQHTEKYPLIWLVYPLQYDFALGDNQFHKFKRVRILFAIQNEIDPSVEQRVSTTEYILQQISDSFIEYLIDGVVASELSVDRTENAHIAIYPNYTETGKNNYVVQNVVKQPKTTAIDNWDVYSLDLDLTLRREDC